MPFLDDIRKCQSLLDPRTRRSLPLSVLFSVVVSAMEVAGIGMILPLLQVLISADGAQTPPYVTWIYERLDIQKSEIFIMVLGGALLAVFTAKNILAALLVRWQLRFVHNAAVQMAVKMLGFYVRLPYQDRLLRNSAELIRNILNSVNMVSALFMFPILALVTETILVAFVIIILVIIDPFIAVSAMLFLSVAVAVFYAAMRTRLAVMGQFLQAREKDVLSALQQGLGATKELRILGREGFFLENFQRHRRGLSQVRADYAFLNALPRYYLEIVFLLAVVLIGSASYVIYGNTDLALMGIFGIAGIRLIPSASRILTNLHDIKLSKEALDILAAEFENLRPEDASLRDQEELPAGIRKTIKDERGLVIDKLSFAYPKTDTVVVKNARLSVEWGESVGLVGRSGAGKSTLVDLILGLLAPDSGAIRVDGRDIKSDLAGWRKRIGYVPQSIYITDDTIRRNIALGIHDKDIDEDRIHEVVAMAQIDDIISSLPDGLDTVLGEFGQRISGGQKQRIGLARALYQDPDVLILDEATSALDNETENRINNTITGLKGEKTVIIIAHRLSTIINCDKLVFMQDGEVAGIGAFESLKSSNRDFAKLVKVGSHGIRGGALSPETVG